MIWRLFSCESLKNHVNAKLMLFLHKLHNFNNDKSFAEKQNGKIIVPLIIKNHIWRFAHNVGNMPTMDWP